MIPSADSDESAPSWPNVPVSGDGVSRTDPRTWATVAEIQATLLKKEDLVSKRPFRASSSHSKEESSFPNQMADKIRTKAELVKREFDEIITALRDVDRNEKNKKGHPFPVQEKKIKAVKKKILQLLQETERTCMIWARTFEDIYNSQDTLDRQLIRQVQRFIARAPEYGYPCSPGLKGSIYSIHPSAEQEWLRNVHDIEKSRQKRAGIPKKALRNSQYTEDTHDETMDIEEHLKSDWSSTPAFPQPTHTVDLVIGTVTKREQHTMRMATAGLSEIPDAFHSGNE
jgi:hypothetical protein